VSGQGTVTAVSDGVWRVVVQTGRDSATGRRTRLVRHVRGCRDDAEQLRAELVALHGSYHEPKPQPVRRPAPSAQRFALEEVLGARSQSELARLVGVSVSAVQAWSERGLDEYRADQVAVALGRHPAEVWPQWSSACEVRHFG
jgi:hypothetical protein